CLQLTMASEAGKTFQRFVLFGDSSTSGTEMNNKNFSKLWKDCGIMDGKMVTSTDVDIGFSKVKNPVIGLKKPNLTKFQLTMKELGQKWFKGKNPDETLDNIYKFMEGKDPSTTGIIKAITVDRVDQLTDASKYTGFHREFDESGKGKGLAEWEEVTETQDMLSAYKAAATYDKNKKR
uniref:Uncharacterized protein n=1 Tax=Loxodonta africana TaxID=9785 RepID=G5E6W0_LOXAF